MEQHYQQINSGSDKAFDFESMQTAGDLPKGLSKNGKKFKAQLSFKGDRHHLGTFDTVEQAAAMYQLVNDKKVSDDIPRYSRSSRRRRRRLSRTLLSLPNKGKPRRKVMVRKMPKWRIRLSALLPCQKKKTTTTATSISRHYALPCFQRSNGNGLPLPDALPVLKPSQDAQGI